MTRKPTSAPHSDTAADKQEYPDPDLMAALMPLAPNGWMSKAWMEHLTDVGSELTAFVTDRIREDVKTQMKMLHCKSLPELQKIQSEFLRNAVDQYAQESTRLVEMNADMAAKLQTESTPS